MSENERTSTVLSRARLPDGRTVVKRETASGDIQYVQRGPNVNGEQFISPSVGEGLEETTELGGPVDLPDGQALEQSELGEFGVNVDRETVREFRIENKYSEWDEVKGIDRQRFIGGDSAEQVRGRRITAFMQNDVVNREIDNDELLETSEEKDKAREALAREIVSRLEETSTETEAQRVLREYGFDY